MKQRIKMIAIDLDGTLLNSQKRISDADIEALQAAYDQGVEIIPVTGRNYSFALPVAQMLPFDVPLVTTNGAVIRSRSGETFLRTLLPIEIASHILEVTPEFRPYTVVVYDQAGPGHLRIQDGLDGKREATTISGGIANSLWLKRNEAMVQRFASLERALEGDPLEILFTGPMDVIGEVGRLLGSGGVPGTPTDAAAVGGPVPPALPNGSTDGEVSLQFRVLRTEYPHRDFAILDAIHAHCSKGHALEHWSRRRGIQRAEIMAIGDNYNDLEMLRFAGLPVVMGNADETLKAQGWPVTLDCDSSGVAHAVRQYVL